jgi:aryl carrier-like protein
MALPFACERPFELTRGPLRCYGTENVIADLTILSSTGDVVAELEGLCLRPITRDAVVGRGSSTTARPVEDERTLTSGRAAPPIDITAEEVARYLQQRCAELAGDAEAAMRLDEGFTTLGLDSIAAMRLSNHVLRDLGRTVTLGQILTCRSLGSLAETIASANSRTTSDGRSSPATQPAPRNTNGSIIAE